MSEGIIIDGVNVAVCRHCDDGICYNESEAYWSCAANEHCHIKQIKRLEQENKSFEKLVKSLYKKIDELEKENEALAFSERFARADYEANGEQENGILRKTN